MRRQVQERDRPVAAAGHLHARRQKIAGWLVEFDFSPHDGVGQEQTGKYLAGRADFKNRVAVGRAWNRRARSPEAGELQAAVLQHADGYPLDRLAFEIRADERLEPLGEWLLGRQRRAEREDRHGDER